MCRQGPRIAPRVSSPLFSRHPVTGRRVPTAGGCQLQQPARLLPASLHLLLDTIFKTFNIKVKFIILDPEKHFVRLRSSRCKQSTTGTKPAPRRRRSPAPGPDGRRGDGCPHQRGDGKGGWRSPSRGVGGVQLHGTGSMRSPAAPFSFGSEFPGMGIARIQAGSSWLEPYLGLCGYTHPQRTSVTPPPLLSAPVHATRY